MFLMPDINNTFKWFTDIHVRITIDFHNIPLQQQVIQVRRKIDGLKNL